MEHNAQVASIILEQLGGARFVAMTGAKNLMYGEACLRMRVGRNANKVTHVTITLEPTDLYRLEFFNVRSGKAKALVDVGGVHVESLRRTFEAHTGLFTTL